MDEERTRNWATCSLLNKKRGQVEAEVELVAGPGQSFCYLPLSFICLFLYLLFLYLSFPFLFFLICLFLFSSFIYSSFICFFVCPFFICLFLLVSFFLFAFFICLGKMIDEEVDESEGKVTDTTFVVGQAKKRGLSPDERFK